ncbi:MAG: hypothetical protein ILO42_07735 [Clostridia bacterium]|nr:hypothetical protein [Clostridia bacterium]MBP5270830.1 hypothetical protein [Clostridia bacterium]
MTVTVWGPPGCGKTTMALRLAVGLSRKSTVSLLFCDSLVPPLSAVINAGKEGFLSVGGALSSVEISEENILKYANVTPGNGNLILFGYAPGENCRSFPVFSEGRAAVFLEKLGKITDYLVIDCPAAAASDPLCVAALRNSDRVMRVYAPDRSSIVFYESNLPLFPDGEFATGRHVRVLNNPDAEIFRPLSETVGAMKRCDYVFPHIRQLKQRFSDGNALDRSEDRRLAHATGMLCGFCTGAGARGEEAEDDE